MKYGSEMAADETVASADILKRVDNVMRINSNMNYVYIKHVT